MAGHSAAARILPVPTSTTVTVPPFAPCFWASSPIICWRYHCRSLLIVSCTVPPSTASVTDSLPGITTPSLPLRYVFSPSIGARHDSSSCSTPALASPVLSRKPSTFPATAPLG